MSKRHHSPSPLPKTLLLLLFALPGLLLAKLPPLPQGVNPWARAFPLFPGILHLNLPLPVPRKMAIQAIQVDLENPKIRFFATQPDPDAGKPMPDCPEYTIRTKRLTTGEFLAQCRKGTYTNGFPIPVVLAVNAAPWSPWKPPYTHAYSDNMGALVTNGKCICPPNGTPGLVITKDNRLEFRDFPKDIPPANDVWIALCGFGMVLKDNTILPGDNPKDLHPRMVWGLNQNRSKLYLVAIDGRQEGFSMGANLHECAQLLQWLGATDALNMDGGGSTTMVFWDYVTKQPRLLNQPTKGGKYQRPVGSSLGIWYQ